MIDVQVKIEGDREVAAKLQQIEATCQGKHPAMQAAWKQIGVMGLRDQQRGFMDRARSGWKRLGMIGVLLRRKSGPIGSFADIQSAASRLQPLRDTNILFNSLTPGGQGSIMEDGTLYVRFGTRVPYAAHHQTGGTAPFSLDERKKKIIKDNLRWHLGGKPSTTPTGKKSRAKKNWNPWAFKMWNAIRRKRSINLPRREIISQDVARANMARYIGLLRTAISKVLGK